MYLKNLRKNALVYKYLYFEFNWHHLYLGLIVAALGQLLIWYTSFAITGDVIRFIGFAISVDDVIQHIWQGKYLFNLIKKNIDNNHHILSVSIENRIVGLSFRHNENKRIGKDGGRLPAFLIHTLLYKYWVIHKWDWVTRTTNFANKLFGAK